MQDKEIKKLKLDDGVTYVNGLGFIQTDNTLLQLASLRRYSTIICMSILSYFLCNSIFLIPATNIAHFLGFEVSINQYTGMILTSPLSRMVIQSFVINASLFVSLSIVCAFGVKDFRLGSTFARPSHGVTPIAIPIIVAVGILGEFLGSVFASTAGTIGIVFPKSTFGQAGGDITTNITLLAIMLIIHAFQEVLFRGSILFTLRRFGDGFAVIASATVFALFNENAVDMIVAFFLGIILAYFAVRAGSMLVALYARLSLTVFIFLTSLIPKYFDSLLGSLVKNSASLLLLIIAACCYVYFIKKDPSAFKLMPADGNLSFRRKLAAFCCTLSFILLAVYVGMSVVQSIQIIG